MEKSGEWGERMAGEFLKAKGYTILDTNYRIKAGEIDIIARDEACIVFVEVKTRKSVKFGVPSEYVTRKKQSRIKKTALSYVSSLNTDMRFDVIEVYYSMNETGFKLESINHIENAF